MPNQIPVMRLTTQAMDALREKAKNQPEIWQNPETDFDRVLRELNVLNYAEPTGLIATDEITMPSADEFPWTFRSRVDHHALAFHRNIPGITPRADGRPTATSLAQLLSSPRIRHIKMATPSGSEPDQPHARSLPARKW